MRPTIHILLPVHNRKAITESFMRCLVAQTWTDFHLVLIDDGSTDGTAAMVRSHVPAATVLRGTGRWWWAGSLQRGLDCLRERGVDGDDLVLVINDDVTFDDAYLAAAVRLMATREDTLLLSRHRGPGGDVVESGVVADLDAMTFRVARDGEAINCLSTRGLVARWRDLERIGGFHPVVLPHYLSDYEYTIRAHRMGFRCETTNELVIVPQPEHSGFHAITDRRFWTFARKYFSKRSPNHPVYWTAFVLLTCDGTRRVQHVKRIWIEAARTLVRAMRVALPGRAQAPGMRDR